MPTRKSSANKSGKKLSSAAAQAIAAQASKAIVLRNAVPQWFRIDPDQVQGLAGGFVWQISDKEQVTRYLIIGSEGGNFYQTPQQVSSQCASCVLRMTRTPDNFKWLCDTIREVSIEGRAAKQESILLALATIIVFAPTPSAKTEALAIVSDCVRILTHLYMLMGYIKIFSNAGHPALTSATSAPTVVIGSGIGRGIRRVFGEYFYSRTGIEIANLITKYKNREGWTIKDVLRLIHINPKRMKDDGGRLIIDHVFGRSVTPSFIEPQSRESTTPTPDASQCHSISPSLGGAPPSPVAVLLSAIKEIHAIALRSTITTTQELDRIANLIKQVGLCREQLPTQLFKYRKVWEALLTNKGAGGKGKGMPLTALIRNLGKLSTAEIGIISSPVSTKRAEVQSLEDGTLTKHICDRITDEDDIKRTRIHPYNILVAMLTYKKGSGDKGSLSWTPNIQIIAALDKAFKLSFKNIKPTGKRIKIALDVSGSMSSAFCAGSSVVNCASGSVAMMMMTLWVERMGASSPPATTGAKVGWIPLDWKTTQLPDGRTLYENKVTNQCQFKKPEESRNTAPTLDEYKSTKKYLGRTDIVIPALPPTSHYGYSSYTNYSTPQYNPELYPPPTSTSNVTICAFSNTLTDLTNAIIGYMDATTDPDTGLPTMTVNDALKLVELPFLSLIHI